MRIAAITSHTEGVFWGAEHGYTRVGGWHWKWINDNVNSPDERVTQQNCKGSSGGDQGGDEGGEQGDDESGE